MARWIQNISIPGEKCVGYTIIAGWLPWNYKCVMTIWSDGSTPLEQLIGDIRKITHREDKSIYPGSTVIYRCNSDGVSKESFKGTPSQEYATREEAQEGHEMFVRKISARWYV